MTRARTAQLALRVSDGLRTVLERAAGERGTTLSAEIVRRLERSFERRGQPIDAPMVIERLHRALDDLSAVQAALVRGEHGDAALAAIKAQDRLRRLAEQVAVSDVVDRAPIPEAYQGALGPVPPQEQSR